MAESDEPSDALAALSEPTRVAILRPLAEAEGPVRFSDLRRRVGVADTGRFSYHLPRLTDHFVREAEAGYELDRAGTRVVTAADVDLAAGGAGDDRSPVDPEGECPVCGEPDCGKLYHVHLAGDRGPGTGR